MAKKKNKWPADIYFHNPNIDKPLEEIWDVIDGYTFEEQYEEEAKRDSVDFVVPLPPLDYKGRITKGIFYSQAADLIVETFPKIKEIFFVIANSMFASYPDSAHADAYFTCYQNKRREQYYKSKYPDKENIIMLPLQDADFMNEYYMAPAFYTPRNVDVFCVSTPYPVKNLPIIAKALKAYEEKYGRVLKVEYALGMRDLVVHEDGTLDYSKLRKSAQGQLREVEEILGDVKKYIDFYSYIEYKDLAKHYSGAKCCVLGSLLEGKNRFISEARSCDTPVVVFSDFNKYARGGYPVFFGNSGEYVPDFTPESLADTIHKVITNQDKYEPRKNYLIHHGRKNFVNTCCDSIPYYRKNMPYYVAGKIHENIWVDLATQVNYQLGYHDFLYGKNPAISFVRGMKNIESLVTFYLKRFHLYNK